MNNLRQLRKQADLTTRELSEYVNISHSVLFYLEKGERLFRQSHIDRLTSFFNVTSDYLLGRSDYGYIVFPEYGEEEIILSESEYSRLSDNIESSIIKISNNNTDLSINTGKEEININMPTHQVYRELKGKIEDYDMKDTLYLKLNGLIKKMTTSDIKKTITFIEEYIFK